MFDPLSFVAGLALGGGLIVIIAYQFITWDHKEIRAYNKRQAAKAVSCCEHGRPLDVICNPCYDKEMVKDFLDKISEQGPLT